MNEQNGVFELPKGWAWTTIGNLKLFSLYGPRFSSEDYSEKGITVLRTSDISDSGKVFMEKAPKINLSEEDFEKYKVKIGDLLITRTGSIGTLAVFNDNIQAIPGAYLIQYRLLNDGILSWYLFYFLSSSNGQKQLLSGSAGVGRQNLNAPTIEAINIPLPPIAEQARIVAKIEELFTKLDAGVDALRTIQKQIKRYRQAVLKCAFEGKLTNENSIEGKLPIGWKLIPLRGITTQLGDGLHGTPEYSDDGEYYFINGNNLKNGKIEIKENTKRVSKIEFEKYKKNLTSNTIFVSINGTLGNTAFYDDEKVVLGKSACYFNLLDNIDKKFIRYYLTSNHFINYANKVATGSTIKNVGLRAMREFEVPVPPNLKEQQKIVEEVERLLSVADAIEATVNQSLKQAERLRQSILKRAFEGKLVPQDDADEPAIVLLERIKQERKDKETEAKAQKEKTKKPKVKRKAQKVLPLS